MLSTQMRHQLDSFDPNATSKCDISVLQTVIIVFCLLRLLVASRSIEWLCYKQRQYDHP